MGSRRKLFDDVRCFGYNYSFGNDLRQSTVKDLVSKSSISNFGCLKTYLLLLFGIIFLSYCVFSCPTTLPLVRDRSILQSYPTDHTINLANKSTQVYQSVRGLVFFLLLSLLRLSLRQQKGEQKPISGICGGFSWR